MKTKSTFQTLMLGTLLATGSVFTAAAQGDTQTDNHNITVTIPTVSLLDLEVASGSKNLTPAFTQQDEAGEKLSAPTDDSSIWLNYSSIQTGTKLKRVDVALDALVPGVDIQLVAAAATSGAGTKGTPLAPLTLTSTAQPLINAIGSAYTLTGTNGHKLTYSFATNDTNYSQLRSGAQTAVKVTYTLVEY